MRQSVTVIDVLVLLRASVTHVHAAVLRLGLYIAACHIDYTLLLSMSITAASRHYFEGCHVSLSLVFAFTVLLLSEMLVLVVWEDYRNREHCHLTKTRRCRSNSYGGTNKECKNGNRYCETRHRENHYAVSKIAIAKKIRVILYEHGMESFLTLRTFFSQESSSKKLTA